ncbi:MAG: sulfatase-like hydrolase/transferase [Chloroflexota bacterium]
MTHYPNILMIITDQERATQHFPPHWERNNLPNMTLLKQNGLTFKNAVCNSCMCSPSRSTLFTGLYPAQHGVTDTLTFGGRYSVAETELDCTFPTLATVLRPYYDCQYRGKWHLSKGGLNEIHPEKALMSAEVALYGFNGWTPPDAGEDTKLENFGGGYANHDASYVRQAIAFVKAHKKRQKRARETGETIKPFFLVLSLVNPHDALSYPQTYENGGYDPAILEGDIELPATVDEDLQTNYKPYAHYLSLQVMAATLGPVPTPHRKRQYLNFYGNLLKWVDREIGELLDLFYEAPDDHDRRAPKALADETVIIRLADHGEMGMAHGGLRQKAFNAYEESLRIPMVFSNPRLFKGNETDQLFSLIDMMPTLTGFLGIAPPAGIRGVDMSAVLKDPSLSKERQDSTLFTFDDIRAGAAANKEPINAADRIRCIREKDWKFARYFRADGSYEDQYEMYYLRGIHDSDAEPKDELEQFLLSQPYEYVNLAYPDNPLMKNWPAAVTAVIAKKKAELADALRQKERLLLIDTNL